MKSFCFPYNQPRGMMDSTAHFRAYVCVLTERANPWYFMHSLTHTPTCTGKAYARAHTYPLMHAHVQTHRDLAFEWAKILKQVEWRSNRGWSVNRESCGMFQYYLFIYIFGQPNRFLLSTTLAALRSFRSRINRHLQMVVNIGTAWGARVV